MAHALLGASKAEQWLNCPPSARAQEGKPDTPSEYAAEGTAAHELAEIRLTQRITVCDSKQRKALDNKLKRFITNNQYYNAEMENAILDYAETVTVKYMDAVARSEDAVVLMEERLNFSEWVPGGFGTGDVVLISDGVLEVIDLKYGKGVPVSAIGNPQLKLYALGALAEYSWLYEITELRMTIIQPRLDSISTDTLKVDELLAWAEDVVKPAADLAFKGEGQFKSGGHCRWCKIKGSCRARAEENLTALEYEFQDPPELTNEEIGPILFIAEQLKVWAKDIEDYAKEQALKGEKIPLWKLVEGRSNRVIKDKDQVISKLSEARVDPDNYLKPQELFGITELEKRVGKKELVGLVGGLIEKPPGKPTLVPETDNRPEINSVDNDFANIVDMED